jgi:hypothetical protein
MIQSEVGTATVSVTTISIMALSQVGLNKPTNILMMSGMLAQNITRYTQNTVAQHNDSQHSTRKGST